MKPGADVVNPSRAVAVDLAHGLPTVRGAGEGDDGVGMGVVDVLGGHEGVEKGLDALTRAAGLEGGAVEIGDHRLVAHRPALEEGQDLVQLQPGEAPLRDVGDVGAGALDPEDGRVAAHVVPFGLLHAGIAAVEVDEGAVGPEEAGAVGEGGQPVPGGGVGVVPKVAWDHCSFFRRRSQPPPCPPPEGRVLLGRVTASGGRGAALGGDLLRVAARSELGDGVEREPIRLAELREEGADIGAEGIGKGSVRL